MIIVRCCELSWESALRQKCIWVVRTQIRLLIDVANKALTLRFRFLSIRFTLFWAAVLLSQRPLGRVHACLMVYAVGFLVAGAAGVLRLRPSISSTPRLALPIVRASGPVQQS